MPGLDPVDDEERGAVLRSRYASAGPDWVAPLLQGAAVTPQVYAAHVPPEHRRSFGQFFTPPRIASWMADWVMEPAPRSLLDPAAGTGVLLEAALRQNHGSGALALTAVDVDPAILRVLAHNLYGTGAQLTIRQQDFLIDDDASTYDAIICNPPYLRHRRLRDRQSLLAGFERQLGIKLSAFSNSYVLFMLKIAMRLSARGRAAIITPVEYLNANFGTPIRSFLLQRHLLDGLLLFEHTRLVFDDANTTACVLLLRADRTPDDPVVFAHIGNETELAPIAELPSHVVARYLPSMLDADAKWLRLFPATPTAPVWLPDRRMVKLGSLAEVRRGIATGANEFFTLTEAERVAHGIATSCVRVCITKAAHAPHLLFTDADLAKLRQSNKKILLLDALSELSAELPDALRIYLERGEQLGIQRRFLPSHRAVWFAMERRPAAPLWVNAFSRGAFRFVLNDALIANLTPFHCIYPTLSLRAHLLLLVAFLNSESAHAVIAGQQRIYGSGLRKFEPRDVAALEVPDPALVPDRIAHEICQMYERRCELERSDPKAARSLSRSIDRLWQAYLGGASAA